MSPQNGTTHAAAAAHHLFDQQFDALKAGIRKLIDRVETDAPSRIRTLTGNATEVIKAHPILAVGLAFGLGYVVMRVARR